jgi:beta-glucuronidase
MDQSAAGLLRPRSTRTRTVTDLSGAWRFAFADLDAPSDQWRSGVPGRTLAAVPGAWSEQLMDGLNQFQVGWYERRIDGPEPDGWRRLLRFDAASLVATVWLDGEVVGGHEGGFLPFAFDITDRLIPGREHVLTVRVEHGTSPLRTPVGGRPGAGPLMGHPGTSYDFFPFGGLIRPVYLLSVPEQAITGVQATTRAIGQGGRLELQVNVDGGFNGEVRASVRGQTLTTTSGVQDGSARLELETGGLQAWTPADPQLYDVQIELIDGDSVVDAYVQPVGLRTIEVGGGALLLNGEPVFLKGFGKHEDFPVVGRGLCEPVIVRDSELMRWVGANSYRTSHYPYAEQALEIADRTGLLVISETSAVGLNFYDEPENDVARLSWVRSELAALIARDRNHPSVIAWSVANEPFAKPLFLPGAAAPEAVKRGMDFLGTLVDDARRLDPDRPVMIVGAQGHPEEFLDLGDILAVNRYYGWYTEAGRPEDGAKQLEADLDALHARFGKPVLVAEFGVDTLPGCHSAEAEMWSEEYQSRFIELYLDVIEARPFVIGAHVWNFADFKTSQNILRAGGLNHKGVFTRDRRPKLAAHTLRRRWGASQ